MSNSAQDSLTLAIVVYGATLVLAYYIGRLLGKEKSAMLCAGCAGLFGMLGWYLLNRRDFILRDQGLKLQKRHDRNLEATRQMVSDGALSYEDVLDAVARLESDCLYSEALSILDKALTDHQNKPALWRAKARCHWRLGQNDDSDEANLHAEEARSRQ